LPLLPRLDCSFRRFAALLFGDAPSAAASRLISSSPSPYDAPPVSTYLFSDSKHAAHTAPAAAGAKQAAGKPTVDGAKAGAALLAAMAPQHREVSRLLYRDFCQQVRHKQAGIHLRGCV
jgi:hypothetical protein